MGRMVTMHFHKARTGLFLMEHFLAFRGVPGNNLAPMKDCSGVQGMSK